LVGRECFSLIGHFGLLKVHLNYARFYV
jgi:hypothetical protein